MYINGNSFQWKKNNSIATAKIILYEFKNVRGKNRMRSPLSLEGNNISRTADVDASNGNVHTRKRRSTGLSEERLCISE